MHPSTVAVNSIIELNRDPGECINIVYISHCSVLNFLKQISKASRSGPARNLSITLLTFSLEPMLLMIGSVSSCSQ